MSDSVRPHGLQPTKLLCPWDFPGNLDSILKSKDISLSTQVCLVKAMVFPSSNVWMWELDYKESCEWVNEVAQSCPTLCDPMDCSLPGSSVHGVFQAGILEWVAISFSRVSSQFRDQTHVSCISGIGRQILYLCATWESWKSIYDMKN